MGFGGSWFMFSSPILSELLKCRPLFGQYSLQMHFKSRLDMESHFVQGERGAFKGDFLYLLNVHS